MEDKVKEFIEIFNTYITRDGSKELLDFLMKSDFFQAPASTRFHSNIKGGLCLHSINVFKRFKKNLIDEWGENYKNFISDESIAICGLLHDICKVNTYKEDFKNVKVDGQWIQKPYFSVDDKLPYGHGEKSVYIINGFIRLTREEAMIINWHMGAFDLRVQGGSYALSDVFYSYPTALLFHVSDIEATYLDEQISN